MTGDRLPTDRIALQGMEFFGHHGIWPREKRDGQRFLVDVELGLNLTAAAAADSLGDTVDYAVLFTEVSRIVEGPPRRLIETLAEAIARRILYLWPVAWVTVRVHKPDAPLPGPFGGVRVEVTRVRDEDSRAAGATTKSSVPTWVVADRQVYLGLGSNLGNRMEYLARGLSGLLAPGDIRLEAVSSVYESQPWGHVHQGAYLNAAARVRTTLSPHEVLARALSVEAACGRVRTQRWGPRTLDIDLVLIGDLVVNEPELVVPHPHLRERAFVLMPLVEIDANAQMPDGERLSAVLATLPDQGVRAVASAAGLCGLVGLTIS